MSITPSDLQTEFAVDFADDDPAVLQRAIERAYRQIGDAWGDLADDGALYLAAHLRTLAKRGSKGAGGAVQSKKVGDVSVTYATQVPAASTGGYSSTPYGLEYERMIMTLPGARVYVDPSDDLYELVDSPVYFSGDLSGDGGV